MERNTLLILLFLIAVTQNTNTQPVGFTEGYIIEASGDTIPGYIRITEPAMLAKQIEFRPNDSQLESMTFTPGEIKGFGTGSLFSFSSEYLEIDSDSIRLFLRMLLVAETSLYTSVINGSKIYVFQKGSDNLVILRKNDQVKDGVFIEDVKYRGILGYQLRDCPEIREKIMNASYSDKQMIDLFTKYNECKNSSEEIVYFEKRESLALQLGPSIHYRSPTFYYSSTDPLLTTGINQAVGLGAGVALALKYQRMSGRFGIQYFEYNFDSEPQTFSGSPYSDWIECHYNFMNVPVGFQYDLLRGTLSPFIFGEANFSYLFNEEIMQYSTHPYRDSLSRTTNPRKLIFGLDAGVGVVYTFNNGSRVYFRAGYLIGSVRVRDRHDAAFEFSGISTSIGYLFNLGEN